MNASVLDRRYFYPNRQRVFLGLGNDWGGHPSTLLHLFRLIASREPVIWVNSVGLRAPRATYKDLRRLLVKGRRAMFHRVSDTPRRDGPRGIVDPKVLPFHRHDWIRRINGRLLARQIGPSLTPWLNEHTDLVFVTSNPASVPLLDHVRPALSVYYCMDDYAAMEECDAELVRECETALLPRMDAVFVTSRALFKTMSERASRVFYLPHGVDVAHFQRKLVCPPALKSLPRPIIGFQGIIGERVDLALLERVALRFPRASVVALGRADVDLSRFKRYRNFRHFDAVPYEALPDWVGQFDIGLIAYKSDAHIRSVNPLKLLEYLTLGIPVVSVTLPELARYESVVSLARNHDDYLDALGALVGRYPFPREERERRKRYAANESWDSRAQLFTSLCADLVAGKRGGSYAPMLYGGGA